MLQGRWWEGWIEHGNVCDRGHIDRWGQLLRNYTALAVLCFADKGLWDMPNTPGCMDGETKAEPKLQMDDKAKRVLKVSAMLIVLNMSKMRLWLKKWKLAFAWYNILSSCLLLSTVPRYMKSFVSHAIQTDQTYHAWYNLFKLKYSSSTIYDYIRQKTELTELFLSYQLTGAFTVKNTRTNYKHNTIIPERIDKIGQMFYTVPMYTWQ